MISRFFIDRPIFASVISIIIVMLGLISLKFLPIAQYPKILPTEVTVSASYPGASAELMANSVASILESQINGTENMLYMTSNSTNNGQTTINIIFDEKVDPAQAEIDVNNRVQAALGLLPNEVQQNGVTVSRKSSTILEIIAISSNETKHDILALSNYALLNIVDNLKRLPGVGDASLFGAANYAMRIWLKPDKMAIYGVTADDISKAVLEQNSQVAIGKLGAEPMEQKIDFTYSLINKGKLSSAQEFEEIILISQPNGGSLKLKQVARVEMGAQDYSFKSTFNNKPAVLIGIYLQSGGNALSTSQLIEKQMNILAKSFPPGIEYKIPFDTTKFIEISIKEVVKTFAEATILVIIVVFLFLQSFRATIIPLIAIPISLIGTLGGLYLFGFSINLLTLFAMILAIGIVVDDAIVVLENVERIMQQEKLAAKDATIKAMNEVSSPVIAIVLVLCAVFLPIAFIGGTTGIIYQQFAVTVVIAVVLSGVVALTLTPALCSSFIKLDHHKSKFSIKFDNFFKFIVNKYLLIVYFFMKNIKLGILIFFIVIISVIYLFKYTPKSLVPDEDQGYLISATNLPNAAALSRTDEVVEQQTKLLLNNEAIEHVISLIGFDFLAGGLKTNTGAQFIILKDWNKRDNSQSSKNIANQIMSQASQISQALIIALNPPAISGLSKTGGFEAYLQYRGNKDNKVAQEGLNTLLELMKKSPKLTAVQTTYSDLVPQYYFALDSQKIKASGVDVKSVLTTLQANFSSKYIDNFIFSNRLYNVYLQAEDEFRNQPEVLSNIFVKTKDNQNIALSSLIKVTKVVAPDSINHFNIFLAFKIIGNPAANYSSSEAIKEIESLVQNNLSSDFTISWIGTAYQEKISNNSANLAFIFAIIMIILILAALYEDWLLPIVVITAVPFAILGALLGVLIKGLNNDVYFQVGIITLIGLSAKNAILLVEFAVIKQQQGLTAIESMLIAAEQRFRPIVMTSLAFILGCVPLAISSGAGSASRHSIGTGVIWGMIFATFLAPIFVPMFYLVIDQIRNKIHKDILT